MLLEPTEIYVKPVVELLRSAVDVRGLAHITSGGTANLLRLAAEVGYEIDAPLPVPPIFALIQEQGDVSEEEMYDVFNMGCGFCVVVPPATRPRRWRCCARTTRRAQRIGRAVTEGHAPVIAASRAGVTAPTRTQARVAGSREPGSGLACSEPVRDSYLRRPRMPHNVRPHLMDPARPARR